MATLYILYESASGYALFQRQEAEEIGSQLEEVQKSIKSYDKFAQMVRLVSFVPFTSPENALENINAIAEGLVHDSLRNFLELTLPKAKSATKAAKSYTLGVSDDKLKGTIQDSLGIPCVKNDLIRELARGIRDHFSRFIKELKEGDVEKAQLGLGHAYSRAKVKFNVNRSDNMIIQSISLLDQLDKDLNTFSMRVREWYSWHFPELIKLVPDNFTYCRLVKRIQNKSNLSDKDLPVLEKVLSTSPLAHPPAAAASASGAATTTTAAPATVVADPATKAREIVEAARSSMGTDISDIDLSNIVTFASRVTKLTKYRTNLHSYLNKRMHDVAPNLSSLIGEQVGARLIAHAGSLTNLAKYPASTVQILGAEKALFRALKTKGNTPKYGLIFHSSFIGRAAAKNKGRISRYLANKCSIASRIDSFSDEPTDVFGKKLREQVEDRLKFYDTGKAPKKNVDVMHEAMEELGKEREGEGEGEGEKMDVDEKPAKKKEKKEKKDKKKKDKKRKKADSSSDDEEEEQRPAKKAKVQEEETPKKKKKKQKEAEAAPVEDQEGEKKKKKKKDKKKKKAAQE